MAIEDWLSREIKKLAQFLEGLLGLVGNTDPENSLSVDVIEAKCYEELGVGLTDLIALENDNFLEKLVMLNFDHMHQELLADLLAALYKKKIEIPFLKQKALLLYKQVQEKSGTFSITLNNKIVEINNSNR